MLGSKSSAVSETISSSCSSDDFEKVSVWFEHLKTFISAIVNVDFSSSSNNRGNRMRCLLPSRLFKTVVCETQSIQNGLTKMISSFALHSFNMKWPDEGVNTSTQVLILCIYIIFIFQVSFSLCSCFRVNIR